MFGDLSHPKIAENVSSFIASLAKHAEGNAGINNMILWLPHVVQDRISIEIELPDFELNLKGLPSWRSLELNGAVMRIGRLDILSDLSLFAPIYRGTKKSHAGSIVVLLLDIMNNQGNLELRWFSPPFDSYKEVKEDRQYVDNSYLYMMQLRGSEKTFNDWFLLTKLKF